MRRVVVGIALALAATSCRDDQHAQLKQIRREVCACKTSSCAEQAIARVPQQQIDSNHRNQKVVLEMMECLAKLHRNERPTTDPDAEAPAPTEAPPAAPATSPGTAGPASGGTP
ncbi:MAG: hypothetical protein ACTHU0_11675 [Kofleriaceae bacterium]